MSRSALASAGIHQRTSHVSERVQNIIISPIKEIALLASRMDDVVPFAWGIPQVPTPKHIRDHLRQELERDDRLGYYSPSYGLPALRSAVAGKLNREFGLTVDPNSEVLITAGAMEGLMSAIQTIVNPGDEVIVTNPGFSSHLEQILLAGGTPVYWNLDPSNHWQPDPTQLDRLITDRTRAILYCSPVNPTGSILSREAIAAVADAALKHDLMVITDEPYHAIVYDATPPPSALADARLHDRRISCFSLSKEYAMTGYRIGYVVAESGMLSQMLKVHDATIVSAPRPSQVAAIAALTGDQQCVADLVQTLRSRRDAMCTELDTLSPWFEYHQPPGSYYIFARSKFRDDDITLALDLLHQAKVAVVPGSAFGPAGRGYLRFCFGCNERSIHEGMSRIRVWLQQHYAR